MNVTPETQAIHLLLDLLEQEQQSLISGNIQHVNQVLEQKSKTLLDINQFAHQRYKALGHLGFISNEQGMQQWLSKHATKPVQSAWLAAQQSLVKAKELNRVNGLLINRHLQRTQQMLSAIQQKAGSPTLYGANGQATSQVRLRNAIVS